MRHSFYPSHKDDAERHDGPIIPAMVQNSPEMISTTLPTGNQVTQSLQLTENFRRWRNLLINKIDGLRAEWETQKSAARNEIDSANEYLERNVFTDTYENRELVVPSAILSLGAFFSGRVMSNPNNWGKSNNILAGRPSFLGRVCTSIPSRLLLPFLLAGIVFKQLTPVTANNIWTTFEKDALPKKFTDDSHRLWKEYYVDGLLKGKEDLRRAVNEKLQQNVKFVRENISDRLK